MIAEYVIGLLPRDIDIASLSFINIQIRDEILLFYCFVSLRFGKCLRQTWIFSVEFFNSQRFYDSAEIIMNET